MTRDRNVAVAERGCVMGDIGPNPRRVEVIPTTAPVRTTPPTEPRPTDPRPVPDRRPQKVPT